VPHLHVAKDGTEAMAFLMNEGEHAPAPRPDLILLDLNMPKMDGRQHEHVLEAVQQRLDRNPQAMRQRRETVEHPFGTL
jgi:CheY-like chemotaxis protein